MNEVIMHNGERFYHSEWVATRDKVIERLEKEKASLLSIVEQAEKHFDKMVKGDVWMLFDDNPVDAYKELAKHALKAIRGS